MKNWFLASLSIFIYFNAFTQHNFKQGYIINLKNDSISGEIDYKRKFKNSQFCYFRKSENDTVEVFSPFQINAYGIDNITQYTSNVIQIDTINFKRVFLETLVKGKISLYEFFGEENERFFIENDSLGRMELPYKEFYKKVFGKDVLHKTNIHKEILMKYMADCLELKPKIQHIYKPTEGELIRLIRKYHRLTDSSERNIAYKKKQAHLMFSIVPTYKYQLSNASNYGTFSINYFGGLIRLGNIKNERIFIKTGILYAKHTFNSENYLKTTQIPFLVYYLYPKYKVKPYFGLGTIINFYNNTSYIKDFDITLKYTEKNIRYNVALVTGFIYDLSNNIGVFSEFGLDFKPDLSGFAIYNTSESYNKFNFQVGLNIKLF